MLMEITKDPSLLKALREEVATVTIFDRKLGNHSIDTQKVVLLPLLQSIFTETADQLQYNARRQGTHHARWTHHPSRVYAASANAGCILQSGKLGHE